MKNLSYKSLEELSFQELTEKDFEWFYENEIEFEVQNKKRRSNQVIIVDGRRVQNWSNARKWIIGFFNKKRQKERHKQFFKRIESGADIGKIRVVSEGDSWFNYPTKLEEVIDSLFDEFSIYSLGYAGDWLSNIYKENEYTDVIRLYKPDVFLISGGGNDLVESRRLETILKKYKKNNNAEDLIIKNKLEKILIDFKILYTKIFENLTNEHPNLKIICHGYDYPFLDGKEKKWFGKPMKRKGIVDRELRNQIARIMIDDFNKMLEEVSNQFQNVFYLNVRNSVSRDNWKDELHPNHDGFKQVSKLFRDKILEVVHL